MTPEREREEKHISSQTLGYIQALGEILMY